MAIYSVHTSATAADDPVFVKDGFSWPAFVFTLFWLLYKRMWIAAIIAAAAMIAVPQLAAMSGNPDLSQTLFGLVMSLVLGFEGNDLLRWSLARRGHREVDLVQGQDRDEVELKYFASRDDVSQPAPAMAVATGPDPLAADALGLFAAPSGRP